MHSGVRTVGRFREAHVSGGPAAIPAPHRGRRIVQNIERSKGLISMAEDIETHGARRWTPLTVCSCVFLAAAFAVTAWVLPYAWPWRLAAFVVLAAGYWALFPKCRFGAAANNGP